MLSMAWVGRTGSDGVQFDRERAGRGQRGQRVRQPGVQHRRVDAPDQVAQLDQGLLGAAVRGVDQLPGAGQVGRAVVRRAELLPGQAQAHGQRGQPDLRAVVQVPLDLAQLGGGVVHRPGPGLLQLADPLGQPARPSRPRISQRSAAVTARASQGAASSAAAPSPKASERARIGA